jgi:predicted permease
VGRVIELNAGPAEVIGVMDPGADLPASHPDLWSPMWLDPASTPQNSHYLNAIGRLRPGVTVDALTRDLSRLTERFPELFPTAYSEQFMREARFGVDVVPLREQVIGDTARTLWILLAAVGLVLVIACANVANLFLVRTESRRREVALRTALGADRIHLAWHYLTESVLLALLAALLGLALAWAGIRGLLAIAPPVPRLEETHLGGASVLFALALAFACGIAFGLFPIARAGGAMATLREGGRTSSLSRGQRAVRSGLIIVQVALALVLLASAGLLVRSYRNLRAVSPGVEPEGVLTTRISVSRANYRDYPAVVDFYERLLDRIGALPGVD